MVNQPKRIALVGNSLPRRCGIATFTTELQQAIAASGSGVISSIVAMTDDDTIYNYPDAVCREIREGWKEDYEQAADFLNKGGFDVVSLQHEFGIFSGEAGADIFGLLSGLTMPVVTTLHTILADPSPAQRFVLTRIANLSSTLVVMSRNGRDLLHNVYQVPQSKIVVIPHGVPDVPFSSPDESKTLLGYAGRSVILSFGLLSPGKGIEVMVDAMPTILRQCPDAVYVVLGATHPNLIRSDGEAYREKLQSLAHERNVADAVVFIDQFVDRETLLDFISMCDVYVTPYLEPGQMTSGTLAYSYGLGKAVVSTPYWHAKELLADGRGVLVPFGDSAALSREIGGLLTDHDRRRKMRKRAYAGSRPMIWARTAGRYLKVFNATLPDRRLASIDELCSRQGRAIAPKLPPMRTSYIDSMCDDTGLFQHAVYSVPDRAQGYCVDDNARALLLACMLNDFDGPGLSDGLTGRFAAFVQHAWNPDLRRFRNFMSFDRRWLEASGSEDSHGRTLWALGVCSKIDVSASRRSWANALFAKALPIVERFRSPRAWAFTLLGLHAYCAAVYPADRLAETIRDRLAARLLTFLKAVETSDWIWFEECLAYDNARLPQALIATGVATNDNILIDAGLRTLRWLMNQQTTADDLFRPVGTESFGSRRTPPKAFDQQPVDAAATVSACLAAWQVNGDPLWEADAVRAFDWFLGRNDLAVPMVDPLTGSCRDGLHPDRANENMGGESVVCYLTALIEMHQFALHDIARQQPAAKQFERVLQ